MAAAVTAARGILPPLTAEEQQRLAKAILSDAYAMFCGKAGRTLTITNSAGNAITARSKAVDIIAFRMAQYRATPLLWGLFLRRHNDGADVWTRLQAHFDATFPEVVL